MDREAPCFDSLAFPLGPAAKAAGPFFFEPRGASAYSPSPPTQCALESLRATAQV